ncbi:MAG TPA: L-glyceraldehyde 3-phosphate reductase [Bacteroidales bacterium]|nr:L-glyceraldehyde 3-phosphate reductase [Bacteroidales bacterium]
MTYVPAASRYQNMVYNRCGASGLMLPAISLGLWHNFGHDTPHATKVAICRTAFDLGITHFDLANNYGPPPGSAEENFGKVMKNDLRPWRDEMIISSKAGYLMWPGPYGEWGSKKYLVASLDQSLKRMGLEYVDIFYHHRPDPDTPLEETMAALDLVVRQGKALYAGISNYPAELAREAARILRQMGTPCLIHQPSYSMFNRWVEDSLLEVIGQEGIGCIAFSPLAQGMLTDRYLKGIPADSRAAKPHGFLQEDRVLLMMPKIRKLNEIALKRGQSLAQMAIAWLLKDARVTSVLVGASSVQQLTDNLGALENIAFTTEELTAIDEIIET